jgi:hypothetical protein
MDSITAEFPKEPHREPAAPARDSESPAFSYAEEMERINAERPSPEFGMVCVPESDVVPEVNATVAAEENAQIDQRIQAMLERRQAEREQCRGDFDRSR